MAGRSIRRSCPGFGAFQNTPRGPFGRGRMSRRDDDDVSVTVADDGEGFNTKTSGTGIGLKNVRERLRLRYNGNANLSVIANFPAGVAATITVPANAPQRSMSNG